MASGGPKLTITVDSWLSDLELVASALFVTTAVDDVSDAAGPGRKCMLQLQPLGGAIQKSFAGRYARLSNWDVAVFRNGGDAMQMVFGLPGTNDSALALLPTRPGQRAASTTPSLRQELVNQAVYIQRPEVVNPQNRRSW